MKSEIKLIEKKFVNYDPDDADVSTDTNSSMETQSPTPPAANVFKSRLFIAAVRIYFMHFSLEMIEVVAITNL